MATIGGRETSYPLTSAWKDMMRVRWSAVLAGVAVLFVVGVPQAHAGEAAAEAQARIAELGLSVAVGYDGRIADSGWQPVAVSLEPSRPVAGTVTVSVSSNWGPVAERVSVEVAAGSLKIYRFLVPTGGVRVTVSEDGAEPVSVRGAGGARTSEFLVGLMGARAQGLPPLRSELISRSGQWVTVDPAWAELSPLALEPLGTVVADVAALQGLSPQGRANLAAGVTAGTDLVVVGQGNVDLAALGLPWTPPADAWQMTGADLTGEDAAGAGRGVIATAFPAGYGRVVLTPVQPGEPGLGRDGELWSALAGPNPRTSSDNVSDYRVAQAPHQFARLLTEKGTRAPALPWLGAFVAVYVLVVGPLNGIVLARMGRRELAWATVPMVTLIFTGGAFLGATAGRPPTGASATLAYWNDGAGGEFVAAGVRAPTPGTRSIQLPGSWTARPMLNGGLQGTVTRGEHTTVAMELTSLQLGGVAAWRGTREPPPFAVDATAGEEGVTVTVQNTSARPLVDVAVRLASTTRKLPDVAPGAEETVTLGGSAMPQASAYRDPFEGLPLDVQGVVGVPVSMRAVLNSELADGRPGVVWVSAVDPEAGVPVRAGAETVRDHGAVVAVGTRIKQGEGLSPYTIQRDGFVSANGGYRPGPEAVEGAGEAFLRFRLPPGADATLLTNQLGRSNQTGGNPTVTVWDRVARQWVPAADVLTDVQPRRVVSPLGEVWARANGEMFPFEYSARTVAGGRK